LSRFWCGFEVPNALSEESMSEKWSVGMIGWCSGEGDDYTTWTALIEAATGKVAESIIRSCYGANGDRIVMRWDPKEKPADWIPGDRFPMPI
jgi:selenophosphate synthetase-related protein